MMMIKVKGENKVRMFNAADYEIDYNVTRVARGIHCALFIDGKTIMCKDFEGKGDDDLKSMTEKMESLVFCIGDLMCVSAMGTNQNVFRVEIDSEELVGTISRTGEAAVLEKYGIHPNQR